MEKHWKHFGPIKSMKNNFNNNERNSPSTRKSTARKGIELIPIGDFTYYDHVLDTAYMLGFIPSRFSEFTSYLDVYFAMARGSKDHVASEMTKWFNTNYHYIVPEYEEGLQISLKDNRPLRLYEEAKQELGVDGKPVILGYILS